MAAADSIVISAIARVVDQATGPLKKIMGAITGVETAAKKSTGAFGPWGRRVSDSVGGIRSSLKQAGSAVGTFAGQVTSVMAPLGMLAGAAGLTGLTKAAIDFANKSEALIKTAKTLGVTVEGLQKFRILAENAELADAMLGKLRNTLITLNKGGKSAQSTIALLNKMGISAQMIKEGNLEKILPLIAKGFEANKDPALQAAAAQAIFGKQWREFLPILQKGTAGLAEAAAKAAKYGIISDEAAKGGKGLADSLQDLQLAVTGVYDAIGAKLAPTITPVVTAISDWIAANRELVSQVAVPVFIGTVAASVTTLGIAVAAAIGPWGLLVGAIVAAGVAIYQYWDDITAFFTGLPTLLADAASSLYNWFTNIDWMATAEAAVQMLWDGFKVALRTYMQIGQFIYDMVTGVDWAGLGKRIIDGIRSAWQAGFDFLGWLRGLDWTSVGRDAGTALGTALLAAWNALTDFNKWALEVGQQIGQALRAINWSEVLTSVGQFTLQMVDTFQKLPLEVANALLAVGAEIGKFLLTLLPTMIRIGADLLKGLIQGMKDALPGLGDITGAIEGKLKGVGKSIGDWGRRQLGITPSAANENAPRPNLLQQQAANANNGEIKVSYHLTGVPNGMTATPSTTQSGSLPNVDVGASDWTKVA